MAIEAFGQIFNVDYFKRTFQVLFSLEGSPLDPVGLDYVLPCKQGEYITGFGSVLI